LANPDGKVIIKTAKTHLALRSEGCFAEQNW
jgi:hypothetical protein